MNKDKMKMSSLVGLAGLGGVTGYLWAGLLTTAGIAAVSNPVGIVCGALVFLGLGLGSDNEKED